MINKSYIQTNLSQLDRLFQKHRSIKEDNYLSKLALLETCGWIEESMDCIVSDCSSKYVKVQDNSYLISQVITNNHSFDYGKFRDMLINLIGIINIERLENNLDPSKFQKMCGALNLLKGYRDTHAHSYTKNVSTIKRGTASLNAPSWTMHQFSHVYEGLKNIESTMRKIKF